MRTKLNDVRCMAGEPTPKTKPQKPTGSQPVVGRLNASWYFVLPETLTH
ncbi:MAG: hypothetical protein U0792_07230 [Gemmataceae bacterium]